MIIQQSFGSVVAGDTGMFCGWPSQENYEGKVIRSLIVYTPFETMRLQLIHSFNSTKNWVLRRILTVIRSIVLKHNFEGSSLAVLDRGGSPFANELGLQLLSLRLC